MSCIIEEASVRHLYCVTFVVVLHDVWLFVH